MSTTLTAKFATRRDAEMTVERLVQEHGIERSNVFIAAVGEENTSGEFPAGSDLEADAPSPNSRDDAALKGPIEVSVDLQDDAQVQAMKDAFAEFRAKDTPES